MYYCKTGKWLLNWESGMYGMSEELQGLSDDIRKLKQAHDREIARLIKLIDYQSKMIKLYKLIKEKGL